MSTKTWIVVAVAGALAGCATGTALPMSAPTKPTVEIVAPRIVLPSPPQLRDVEFDVPRDMDRPVIRDTEECRGRIEDMPGECIYYPPLENSNILLGVDSENWANLSWNMEALRQYIHSVQSVVESYNKILDRLQQQFSREGREDGDRKR